MFSVACGYCKSTDVKLRHKGEFHKVDDSFGPFDLFRCGRCGSLGTANPPTLERLAEFYRAYDDLRPQWYYDGALNGALASQYKSYAQYLLGQASGGTISWADVGAGHGELSKLLATSLPSSAGRAIDIGDRPAGLPGAIEYSSLDLNGRDWRSKVGQQFDLVFSVAVWEHVLSPGDFARESLSLVAPGGTLVMITPDYGSLASKVLRRNWPYFEPGEHISIPTAQGARLCARSAMEDLRLIDCHVTVSSVWVGYSLSYLMSVLRLRYLADRIPPRLAVSLPTGILSTIVKRAE